MRDNEEKKTKLIRELVEYFLQQNFKVLAARELEGYRSPLPIHNDGFGDQRDKQPDVLAYNSEEQVYILGIARTGENDLETEESLTEYNVFLDQSDDVEGRPYRLYIITPASNVSDLTSLITHYIHRDYWHKITFVASRNYIT